MLNITHNTIKDKAGLNNMKSFQILRSRNTSRGLIKTLYILGGIFILILFLPWTQNIKSASKVTALKPNQRPQTIHSIIAGRIEKWYVQEGQLVKKGDTILYLSETKSEYLDPNLVSNTEQQLKAKEATVKSYFEKVNANDNQIDALIKSRILKLEQTKNKLIQANLKVQSDSIDLAAAQLNQKIAKDQLTRMEELFKEGLKSLTDLETRRQKLQEAQAKLISQENKYIGSKNEVLNVRIELQSINAEYNDKIAKSESDKFASLSSMYDAEALVSKLQNQFENYRIRSGMYYVLAPQDGYITKAIQSGIGQTIKEGEEIISIMPYDYELAIEMYVNPMDIPLLQLGQHVQVQFDGWPAIIFSGWPGISFGTYGGKIVAIDNFVSENGKYRVLVAHDKDSPEWPKEIRLGAGAQSLTLLKEVPVWYELWRQINGFPPDYYKQNLSFTNTKKQNEEKK
ncbi:MAG TPA: HlyD family efflux transporter periplasmic adaptor subunit [Bacteroidia bacterium]|nr:HlyD family efflux transporter periplasmic adaptor subunit [Bacteroidia bacterium]